MGKFVRRHGAGLATATAITLLLVAGVVASTWQAVRARRAEKQASTVANFLEDMLNSVRPEEAKGRDTLLLREIMDKAAARVDDELRDHPEIQARLNFVIGKAYSSLFQSAKAEPRLRAALAIQTKLLGMENLAVAEIAACPFWGATFSEKTIRSGGVRTRGFGHPPESAGEPAR